MRRPIARLCSKLSFSCERKPLARPSEAGAIDPHPVQDDAKLPSQGDPRLFFAPRRFATPSAQLFNGDARCFDSTSAADSRSVDLHWLPYRVPEARSRALTSAVNPKLPSAVDQKMAF